MSEKELLEYIKKHDQVAKNLGIEPLEARPGYGKAMMPLDDRQCNSAGIAHGGAIFSLADLAIALASNSEGYLALTLNTSITYLKPGLVGPLTAEAVEIGRASRVFHYEITVRDGNNEIIAHCHGTAYKKDQKFPPAD